MKYILKGCLACFLILSGSLPVMGRGEPVPLNVFYGEIPQADQIYYVALDGNDANPGTEAEPFATLPHAISQVRRGEVIVMRGGVYHHNETIRIQTPSGFFDDLITLTAYPGEVPILDFSSQPRERNLHGLRINANFWHVIGITVRYAAHNGIRMDGSYNILEQMTSYGHHDTGIHMAGGASNNLIKNSDSFHNFNYDTERTPRIGNNADGFGAKFNIGPGNRYEGCRAWENSDDGFDFWEAQSTIVIENSWAFGNGDASVFGNPANFEGNGNGFKLGGNHVRADHVVLRSMAFDNFGASGNAKGFDFNNNPGAMTLRHNTAYNNGRNYWFPLDPPNHGQSVFINNLSAVTSVHAATPPSAVLAGNSWMFETPVTEDMFLSVDTAPAQGPREMDGSLPDIDLLRPVPGSFLVDGGVAIGEPFYGSAPDIGVFAYEQGELVDAWVDRGSGAVVNNLTVFDLEHAADWDLRTNFQNGTLVYGDDEVVISGIPPGLFVDEWIQTANATRAKNYLFTTAEFSFSSSKLLMVAHADAITNKPAWLNAFEATDLKLSLSGGGSDYELTIYALAVEAGEPVTLGRNSTDGRTDVPMYVTMAGDIRPVSVEDSPTVPADFVLHQNYPNPFGDATTIAYTVPQQTRVSVRVYDVMGRQVAELADGSHQAGRHSVVWHADAMSSGVYFVRMVAGETTVTRQLVVVR